MKCNKNRVLYILKLRAKSKNNNAAIQALKHIELNLGKNATIRDCIPHIISKHSLKPNPKLIFRNQKQVTISSREMRHGQNVNSKLRRPQQALQRPLQPACQSWSPNPQRSHRGPIPQNPQVLNLAKAIQRFENVVF